MKIMHRLENFIFTTPRWKFITSLLSIMLFKTGIWYMSGLQSVARHPFINPFTSPEAQYNYWSWLGPFLAWCIGATGKWSFFGLQLLFAMGFTAVCITTFRATLKPRAERIALLLFFALPVSATAYFWVGTDALTLLLMMLAIRFSKNLLYIALIGIALGMQHFEQAFCGISAVLGAIILSYYQKEKVPYPGTARWAMTLLMGIIAGKLTLLSLFHAWHVEAGADRLYFLQHHRYAVFSGFFLHFPYVLWSTLNLGWLALFSYLEYKKNPWPFLIPLAGLGILLLVSLDETRVFAITSFWLIAIYWLLNEDFIDTINNQWATWLFLTWIIVPWGWVWEGIPRWSAFPYDIAIILHHWLGWFPIEGDVMLWPFKS